MSSSSLSLTENIGSMGPRKLRALVVDPSQSVRKIIKKSILLKLGILAGDSDGRGESVFNIVRKSMIDVKSGKISAGYDMLLLSHSTQSESNGNQTARYLRQLGYDGLIIMLFGDMTIDEAVYFREWGIDAAILKPLTIPTLLISLHGCGTHVTFSKGFAQIDQDEEEEMKIPEHVRRFRDTAFNDNFLIKNLRILIVDDSATCRKINNRLFKDSGHHVIEADCGFVALRMIQNALTAVSYGAKSSFDIILMSNVMKGMNGQETTEMIRKAGFEGIVVGIMASCRQDDVNKFIAHGADFVVQKPLNIAEFNESLRELCFPLLKFARGLADIEGLGEGEEDEEEQILQAGMALQKKHLKILVIEESSGNRRELEDVLSQLGHSVVVTSCGPEGLQEMKKAQVDVSYGKKDAFFDLLVLGHVFQGLNAAKTVEKIRSLERPIMILGVKDDKSVIQITEFRSAGVDGILSKPLTALKFKKAVAEMHMKAVHSKSANKRAAAKATMSSKCRQAGASSKAFSSFSAMSPQEQRAPTPELSLEDSLDILQEVTERRIMSRVGPDRGAQSAKIQLEHINSSKLKRAATPAIMSRKPERPHQLSSLEGVREAAGSPSKSRITAVSFSVSGSAAGFAGHEDGSIVDELLPLKTEIEGSNRTRDTMGLATRKSYSLNDLTQHQHHHQQHQHHHQHQQRTDCEEMDEEIGLSLLGFFGVFNAGLASALAFPADAGPTLAHAHGHAPGPASATTAASVGVSFGNHTSEQATRRRRSINIAALSDKSSATSAASSSFLTKVSKSVNPSQPPHHPQQLLQNQALLPIVAKSATHASERPDRMWHKPLATTAAGSPISLAAISILSPATAASTPSELSPQGVHATSSSSSSMQLAPLLAVAEDNGRTTSLQPAKEQREQAPAAPAAAQRVRFNPAMELPAAYSPIRRPG